MKIFAKTLAYLFIFSALCFWLWYGSSLLFQSRAATGVDGYYYVLQINSFLESGQFYFQTGTPLVLYFLSVLAFFTGDPVVAAKFGAIVLQILLCLGMATLLRTLTKNLWLAALGVFLLLFSVLHLYFLSEFISNLGATVFLVWGAVGTVKAIHSKRKIWFLFAGSMLAAAIFSHRSSIWLIICLFFFALLSKFWLKDSANAKLQFSFSLIIVVLFVSPLLLAWQPFLILPEWLSSELLKYPRNPFRSFILMESLMLLIGCAAMLLILLVKPEIFRKNPAGVVLFSIFLWSLLVTLNPFLNHQAGIAGIIARLDALAYLQVAITVPLLLSLLSSRSEKSGRFVIALFLPLLVLRLFAPVPLGLREEFLRNREKLIRELPQTRARICEAPLIIARHGEQFMVTAILRVPAQQKPPIENQFQCIYWLVHQSRSDYQIIFDNSAASSDGDFTLVEDSKMKEIFQSMPAEEQARLISENLHLTLLSDQSTR
jgi:hypothetical protein